MSKRQSIFKTGIEKRNSEINFKPDPPMNNDSNQNTNNPTDDQVNGHIYTQIYQHITQQSDRFETDSNWTDVQSQRSDDDIILLDDEEINRIEDEIFDEDEEGKQGFVVVTIQITDKFPIYDRQRDRRVRRSEISAY